MMRAVTARIALCLILAAGLSGQTLDETVRALARKVMARLGPADVPRVTARSLSDLGNAEVEKARIVFERAIRRPVPRTPQPVDVTLSLSQNIRGYLIVANFERNGQRIVEMVDYRPDSAVQPGRAILERQLLLEQDTPILDVAPEGERMYVLEPTAVSVWQAGARVETRPYETKPSRDPRGRLEVAGGAVRVAAPGLDQPFTLAGERATFSGIGNLLQSPGWSPYFSTARAHDVMLIAQVDGRVHLYDSDRRPAGVIEGWGSDILESQAACGPVLATSGADRDSNDTLTLFDIVERRPVAVSDPLQFSGAITALWPAPDGAVVIARNSSTGKYAAYKIAIRCSQ